MSVKWLRRLIGALAAFVAVTAIGGGIAILVGADEFPSEWLQGTPFADYTVPALLLAVVVGGSSLAAAVLIFSGRRAGATVAAAAGALLAGYVAVEVAVLQQTPPGPTPTEIIYFALGVALVVLTASLWHSQRSRSG